jgi:flagellar basal body-associated protein FliL
MAEETQEQEGTMSGLKKTLIGAVGTIVTAGGVWAASLLGGGDKAEPAPVQAAPVINITTNQTQQQAAGGNKTIIINKGADGKPAQPVAKPKKKEGDEFKEADPKW